MARMFPALMIYQILSACCHNGSKGFHLNKLILTYQLTAAVLST